MTIWLKDAPAVDSGSGSFRPIKAEVSEWNDRAKVTLIGRVGNAFVQNGVRSVVFNLWGYDKPQCPQWLEAVLLEAGYSGYIIKKASSS